MNLPVSFNTRWVIYPAAAAAAAAVVVFCCGGGDDSRGGSDDDGGDGVGGIHDGGLVCRRV